MLTSGQGVWGGLGNVYTLASEITLTDLRYSAGLGLRYRTPLGPLRVESRAKAAGLLS